MAAVTQLIGRDPVKFTESVYNITVQEDVPLGPLLTLYASTAPPGESIEYRLVSGTAFLTNTTKAFITRNLQKTKDKNYNSEQQEDEANKLLRAKTTVDLKWFEVERRTGVLKLVKELDYEVHMQHCLRVRAVTSIGVGEAEVRVSVTDANDHSPVFPRDKHETQITEEDDRHLPKAVLRVQATDDDAGKWGEIRYSIAGDGIPYYTRRRNNTVYNNLKYLKPTSTPTSSTVSSFYDNDFAEYSPTFDYENYIGDINKFSMIDMDTWLSFSNDSYFIPPLTDNIIRNNSNSYRTFSKFPAKMQSPKSSQTLSSKISDSALSDSYTFPSIAEYLDKDHPIPLTTGRTKSVNGSSESKSHSQSWLGSKLQSSIIRSPSFTVDPENGTVFVMLPLDRDGPHGKAKWHLKVTASDGERNATTDVLVNLKDVNDNSPAFASGIVRATIKENAPTGTEVIQVSAVDPDDPYEGRNAQLVYSLQKNVIDESSGKPIFSVNATTGTVSTDLCCLDREHTTRYMLQLAATDGGGLQGTCTVLVMVTDVNDVPPRWGSTEWKVEVEEGLPVTTVLAGLPVTDPDLDNNMAFRVVPGSGRGWQLVELTGRADGTGAELRSKRPLDYEDPNQRKGLRFQVQVTDQGDDGWSDQYRIGVAYVTLQVLDVNDNSPVFVSGDHLSVTLKEDAAVGTHVARMPAFDKDAGPASVVSYGVSLESNPVSVFAIDDDGAVTLARHLDREHTSEHILKILAWDSGHPARTATATLVVKVSDINDNPPYLLSSRTISISANLHAPQTITFNITLTDLDDWSQSNGPPFRLHWHHRQQRESATPTSPAVQTMKFARAYEIASENTVTIRTTARLVADPLGSGPDGLSTISLVVSDAGTPVLSSTVTITLNRERIAKEKSTKKIVNAYIVQRSGAMVPLGQVSDVEPINGPSEASQRSSYSWLRAHPFFQLDQHTGVMHLIPSVRPGRYHLEVLTRSPDGEETQIDLTAMVYQISASVASQAIPVEVASSAQTLLRMHSRGSSLLSQLIDLTKRHLALDELPGTVPDVEVVSINDLVNSSGGSPSCRLWFSTSYRSTAVELILRQYSPEIESTLGISILGAGLPSLGGCTRAAERCMCCCQDITTITGNFSLINTATYTHVGPNLELDTICGCKTQMQEKGADFEKPEHFTIKQISMNNNENEVDATVKDKIVPAAHAVLSEDAPMCRGNTCLNGGRCLIGSSHRPRCVCPAGTEGPTCKILARQFIGHSSSSSDDKKHKESWAWLPALPSCTKLHISLYVLTSNPSGLLLYVGSRLSTSYQPHILLQINNGMPQAMVRTSTTGPTTTITLKTNVANNEWHRIDIGWFNKTFLLYVDLCSGKSMDPYILSKRTFSLYEQEAKETPSLHNCRQSVILPSNMRSAGLVTPVQLGSKLHSSANYDNMTEPVKSFVGCVSHLRVNKKLQDLGSSIVSERSFSGCDHLRCQRPFISCPSNSKCVGFGRALSCPCEPGYTGLNCRERTTPATLQDHSFAHIALSFAPQLYSNILQMRIRTRESSGLIISLSSRHGRDALSVYLEAGQPCVGFKNPPHQLIKLCLRESINDGEWHIVRVLRFGSNLEIFIDEGDGSSQYASLLKVKGKLSITNHETDEDLLDKPQLLYVHRQEGVSVGGRAEFHGSSTTTVHSDLRNTCLDDIRLDGHPLPLPPNAKVTQWGAVTFEQGIVGDCEAPDSCNNVSCAQPLTCRDAWRSHYCGCVEGRTITPDRSECVDIDECHWNPCFSGGSCFNTEPGYHCLCRSNRAGAHCEQDVYAGLPLSTNVVLISVVAAAGALAVILASLLLCILYLKRRKKKTLSSEVESYHCSTKSSDILKRVPSSELESLRPTLAKGGAHLNTANSHTSKKNKDCCKLHSNLPLNFSTNINVSEGNAIIYVDNRTEHKTNEDTTNGTKLRRDGDLKKWSRISAVTDGVTELDILQLQPPSPPVVRLGSLEKRRLADLDLIDNENKASLAKPDHCKISSTHDFLRAVAVKEKAETS